MFPAFKLLFLLILAPVLLGLLVVGLISRKNLLGKFVLGLFGLGIILISSLAFISWWNSKTILDKDDYYGDYIIDRQYFSGEQADWQYNHFRFKITEDDSIFFFVTEQEKILKTYKGTTQNPKSFSSARLAIRMEQPTHHVVEWNPTTYRDSWGFYLVFRSSEYSNMYFKKGIWEPIND